MIETVLAVAAILYLALQIEDKLSVPSPLSLIALSYGLYFLLPDIVLTHDAEQFAALVLLLLPILLIADSLELRVADLREHALSLFYLAVVAVALSVVTAIFLGGWLFDQYNLSMAAIIVLFAMVLATDPVSVVSIFSKFELPHRLKILAEGESLFNDATALIVFVFIGLYALEGGEITATYVGEISLLVVLGSAALGISFAYLGLVMLKTTENRFAELMVLILTGYGAFTLAEHFYSLLNLFGAHSHLHLSGILACIFATVTLHHQMTKETDAEDVQLQQQEDVLLKESGKSQSSRNLIANAVAKIRVTIDEQQRHYRTKEDIQLLALVANTMLFVAMAEIVDIDLLLQYKKEILIMFLATTVIRAIMMAKFALITNQTDKMTNVNFRWWGVLTFAGIKGGLSVVMLMMIPASFEHLDMFKAVVVGVILLSTFIYSLVLLYIIGRNAEIFRQEKEAEHHS
ncbi:MAG: sodium:proton antiporter [Zetaproteobacteria bacterium CG06_land_8_20_14_3_00_59_53]|nr:MAG: sodium:proton antiporter [Zetaproteobacteria bacterium CG2_30_59_37]PIO89068.1 MAG: sodium:proton antiporter [Zetaproteobacteria bacterium CG23_combo_of_CG06-09_8_20_14_all_59_86]PIQ65724.1 MAG: sodium:proton antiporter [Zetaproteobacteria bacterium CG11_big_fil_rev_8_21_14_0_20_59_439]PIU70246.1 MAG: sodium:proton antiporter [Zetaproteobacteria bacterium CG06_land_8_20_14_3_00_59_53]PIU96544.1 MAG: sodium:proton antiporter [Zetaproteobacteria bacterium CG03_land_8_20_14_0_80_59_51]PIY